MQSMNATQARKEIYNLIKAQKRIEIRHKEGAMVLLPKEELDRLERDALAYEMDQIRASEEKFTDEQVNAMLAKVMNG